MTSRRATLVAAAAAALLVGAAGCSAKLGGSVTVDDKPFEPKSCRSGQALGFMGVELTDAAGKRLRLVSQADGTCGAIVFAVGAMTGDDLGRCGPFLLTTQNSTINNVRNVMGKAALDCRSGPHVVHGDVSFENCH